MTSSKRKKERRRMRYLRNVRKEVEYKKEAWENGKLIEENHNQGPYSAGYSIELGNRLMDIIQNYKKQCLESTEPFLDPKTGVQLSKEEVMVRKFRLYRMKIRDFILHYNPDIPKTEAYEYLKQGIETYWDNPENLINVL